jgi:hypothetical protein
LETFLNGINKRDEKRKLIFHLGDVPTKKIIERTLGTSLNEINKRNKKKLTFCLQERFYKKKLLKEH